MDDVEALLARAQVSITRITLIGFLVMLLMLLILLVWPGIKASPEIVSLVSAATGSLGTILTQQNGYFFQRQRPHSTDDPPDPNPIQPPQAAKPSA